MDELVVVGYGVQRKSDITGALTQVTEKQIKQRPVQNALQAMQGKAPVVDITSNNRPGELGEVRIRGNRSLNADNDPLYVVDGIPLTAGFIADINSNDIASMEVLKDASATAIYGSRGANGVVLITTKKGTAGKVTINYDGTVTFSRINSMTDWMNSGQLMDWTRQSQINGGTYGGAYGTAPDPNYERGWYGNESYMDRVFRNGFEFNADGTPVLRQVTAEEKAMVYADMVPVYNSDKVFTQNWTDLITRTALTNNHQVSLSAGSDNSRLYMSFAYLNQESPMIDQDFERFTVNINGEISPRKWLKVGMALNASHSIQNYGIINNSTNSVAKDSYGLAVNMMPYAPAYDEEGNVLIAQTGVSQHNLLVNINESVNENRSYSTMFSSFAEVTLLPWLRLRTNFGSQFRNSRNGSFQGENWTNPLNVAPSGNPLVAYNRHKQELSWTLENLIYINKDFGDIHSLGVTLLQSAEKARNEDLNARAYEVTYPTSLWYNLWASKTSDGTFGSSFSEQTRASYMGRINYSLMDKYLVTLTGRYDGASVLAAGNKWDFFPSAAIAWKLDQEDFMQRFD